MYKIINDVSFYYKVEAMLDFIQVTKMLALS